METNSEPLLFWLIKVVGLFGLLAVVAALALGVAGLILCFTGASRKSFIFYLLLAQFPILVCLVGALRSWILVQMVIQRADVMLKPSQWAEFWKDIWTLILWGVAWSVPLDILGFVGLGLRRRKRPASTRTP